MATLVARQLHLPADPLGLARRLDPTAELALLHDARPHGGRSWLAAWPDDETQALDPKADAPMRGAFADTPEWIGIVPYEARRHLERPDWAAEDARPAVPLACPSWRRYPALCRIDRHAGEVMVIGRDAASVMRLCRALDRPPVPRAPAAFEVGCDEPAGDHLQRIARARQLIVDGDLYQVNLARRLDVTLTAASALDGYALLVARAPNRCSAFLRLGEHSVLSTSPELLLALDGQFLSTSPIKGTRPRGRDAIADAALAAELDRDEKERAELAMIVDVERNDVARVCRPGTVRVAIPPRIVTSATVHHRAAVIKGELRHDASRGDAFEALLPSGSVTGAPKIRAMEVIAELERHRRGLYTGGFGYVSHDGGARLGMAIRTLVLDPSLRGTYWAGGGIVADSDPARELEETGWKARQLGR